MLFYFFISNFALILLFFSNERFYFIFSPFILLSLLCFSLNALGDGMKREKMRKNLNLGLDIGKK